jgi:hypothetical protein
MNCSSTTAQDAVGCLAGHLLAAKLNVANGANKCIGMAISEADTFLRSIKYTGPAATYRLTTTQRTQALRIKDVLDPYNNNVGCGATALGPGPTESGRVAIAFGTADGDLPPQQHAVHRTAA